MHFPANTAGERKKKLLGTPSLIEKLFAEMISAKFMNYWNEWRDAGKVDQHVGSLIQAERKKEKHLTSAQDEARKYLIN